MIALYAQKILYMLPACLPIIVLPNNLPHSMAASLIEAKGRMVDLVGKTFSLFSCW
jgi:hypothetical protein